MGWRRRSGNNGRLIDNVLIGVMNIETLMFFSKTDESCRSITITIHNVHVYASGKFTRRRFLSSHKIYYKAKAITF